MPSHNGDHVTRAELNAHLQPLRDNIREIKDDVHEIRVTLGAGPRWLGARANAVIDKLLPTAIALGAVWLLGEKLSGG
jgi:hypothetical protein